MQKQKSVLEGVDVISDVWSMEYMDDYKNIPAVVLGVLVFRFAHTGASLKCN